MKVVLSWLKDYVDIDDISVLELARMMTMAGMEVENIKIIGLPMPETERREFKMEGLEWPRDKFVVAQINEVMPHPDADRLVLCRLDDDQGEQVILTGAPNMYPYKGKGPLEKPIKVAYAREGAIMYDGHKPGFTLTKLKKTKIRGFETSSMVCSEKELGISEEHEGNVIFDDDAPTGMPLMDYIGDAVLEFEILPNMVRDACMIGVAREIAAILNRPLQQPQPRLPMSGPSIKGQAAVKITDPSLNPRFMLGLIRDARPLPSPYWVQRRLRLAGIRPINSIVDATNYVMLETNEPLHAFDYDELVKRAGGKAPTIITRAATPGEKLTTLDDVEHELQDFTILVTDTAGPLSLAGIMGGLETEVTENTRNVLLEAASWNFINVRRTANSEHLSSEAGYRFSRGIHPAVAKVGLLLGLDRIAEWSGGEIAADIIDNYPAPYTDPTVDISTAYVKELLGIDLSAQEIAGLLTRLEFKCEVKENTVYATSPDHRTDINEGVIGRADVLEEIARLYGYDNIPATRLSDTLAAMHPDKSLELEEKTRDILARFDLQEIITYRFTAPEIEDRLLPPGAPREELPYITLKNPISADRRVLRRTLLPSMLEVLERNIRLRPRLALFEVGPVFLPKAGAELPDQPTRLGIVMSGARHVNAWDEPAFGQIDFYDLKGVVEALLDALHISGVSYEPDDSPLYHPRQCARMLFNGEEVGTLGALHPIVKEQNGLEKANVMAAEIDLTRLFAAVPERFELVPVPVYPPILEDIAVIVDEETPAAQVQETIQKAGGSLLADIQLFDIYRGVQIGEGKKSLAYNLTYIAPDHTLNDKEAAKIRLKIIKLLERELGAKLRS